jgi:hypothetical protein
MQTGSAGSIPVSRPPLPAALITAVSMALAAAFASRPGRQGQNKYRAYSARIDPKAGWRRSISGPGDPKGGAAAMNRGGCYIRPFLAQPRDRCLIVIRPQWQAHGQVSWPARPLQTGGCLPTHSSQCTRGIESTSPGYGKAAYCGELHPSAGLQPHRMHPHLIPAKMLGCSFLGRNDCAIVGIVGESDLPAWAQT